MKKLVSLMLVLALVLSMSTMVNAVVETANIKVSLDKSTAKVGDEITVTVDWTEKMEAVDLELGFDKTKVEFVSSSMSEDYIATDRIKEGVVQISWFSMNGKGITNITYKFKVIADGAAKFTTAEAVLADANVESPENYKYGTAILNDTTKPDTDKPSTDDTTKPGTDKPSTDDTTKPGTDKPSTDDTTKPGTDKPSTDDTTKPGTDKPSTDTTKPSTDKPSTSTTKKPTTIPQAGINMIECAIIVLAVIAIISLATVVIKARRK